MAKRIITAVIAIPLGIACILADNYYILLIAISAISLLATYELLMATKYINFKLLSFVSLLFVAVTPLIYTTPLKIYARPIFLAFIFFIFITMLIKHERIKFSQMALIAFISYAIPLSMSTLIFMRFNSFDDKTEHGLFYIFFALISAWIGDSGAYFVGTFFGKTPLAPTISPKKTVEGFWGGIATSAVISAVFAFCYELLLNKDGAAYSVNWLLFGIIAIICAMLGVLGDLSASLLKRECSVKDFGSIMPGHGGILDRFDSVLFVAPFVYQIMEYCGKYLIVKL